MYTLIAYRVDDRKVIIRESNSFYLLHPEYSKAICKEYISEVNVREAIEKHDFIEDTIQFKYFHELVNYVVDTIAKLRGQGLTPNIADKEKIKNLFSKAPSIFIEKAIDMQLSKKKLNLEYVELIIEVVSNKTVLKRINTSTKLKIDSLNELLKTKLHAEKVKAKGVFNCLDDNDLDKGRKFERNMAA